MNGQGVEGNVTKGLDSYNERKFIDLHLYLFDSRQISEYLDIADYVQDLCSTKYTCIYDCASCKFEGLVIVNVS